MTALIVDNDPQLRHRVRAQLQDRGVQVSVAAGVAEAIVVLGKRSFHVVVIDVGLPDGSGLGVLEALRTSGSTAHVIVLSESSCELDHLEALHRGADDLVVKPFFVRELVARVLAVPRPRDPETDTFFQLGRCDIDLRSRRVTCAGELVELTVKEFDLLAYLAVRPGHVVSREELLNAVWHSAPEWQQSATVTEHVRRLRSKIEDDPAHPTIVITVRGAGYRLDLPIGAEDVPLDAAPPPDPGVMVHVEGRIVFADAAASDLVAAADGSALVGRHILELIASTSQTAAAARLADADAGRPRRSEIMQLLRSDGEQVTVEVASDVADWHGTRARRVQLTGLSDAPSRLRRLVTAILADVADAVIITDLSSHIRSWNSAAERIYGWSEEAVLGRHLLDILPLVPGTDQPAQAPEHLEKTGTWKGAVVHTARDGSTVRTLGSTTVLHDEGGEPIGVVSVNRPTDVPDEVGVLEMDPGLVARVRQGIIDDEFVVHYQPIVGLTGGRPLTVEALVRWEHPDRGTLAPAEFLAAAERSGSIVELGELVLEKACRQAAAWRRSGADIRLSVNVSTRQLSHPGLADRFEDTLRRTGFDPVHLWLEVTETAVVEELEKASQVLRTLASRGVGVAIDDFGTGWASLTYLQSFPVHALKIDRRFVAGAGFDHTSAAIVRSILSLGAELGLFVVAEGVETERQHELLKAMGCTLGQGYLYGRPGPAEGVPIERAGRVPEPAGAVSVGARDLRAVRGAAGDLTAPATTPTRPSSAATLKPRVAQSPPPIAARGNDPRGAEADRIESDAVAAMLRGLLRVSSAHGAVDLLQRTIQQLGGETVPVAEAGDDALPVDVSLGEGPPVLVEAERFTVARMRLERALPRLVEDARHAVDLLRRTERLQDETIRDGLTGLANRRVLDRVLPRASSGSIVMLDLDHFKQINDEHGHAAGDDVLRAFGRILGTKVRAQDIPCRIGGEEFAVVLADLDVAGAVVLVERIRETWLAASPRPVTFSAGVAAVTHEGGPAALLAADRALYRAKGLGRNRTERAPHAPARDSRT